MAQSVDLGNDTLYTNDVYVGDTTPGSLTGTSVSSTMGTLQAGVTGLLSSTGPVILSGSGAPTSTAAHGTVYINTTGATVSTRMYINTTGASTWTAFTTLA